MREVHFVMGRKKVISVSSVQLRAYGYPPSTDECPWGLAARYGIRQFGLRLMSQDFSQTPVLMCMVFGEAV